MSTIAPEPCGHALFDACSAGDACVRRCSRQLRAEVQVIHLPPVAHVLQRRDTLAAAILITAAAIALCWAVAPDALAASIAEWRGQ